MGYQQVIEELVLTAQAPAHAVRQAMARSGKKAVGCFPVYAPEEIVYAAGMLPVGMWGGPTVGNRNSRYLQSFCCSIIRANTEQALRGDYDLLSAIVIPAFCDTLKCTIENWKVALPDSNIIPVVYAQNRKTPAGRTYMREEFQRVCRCLEHISGHEISQPSLSDALDLYDDYRRTMQAFTEIVPSYPDVFTPRIRHMVIKAGFFMDKAEYTAKIKALLEDLPPIEISSHKRIVLTGIMSEPVEFLDILGDNGFVIAADDLAQESRQFRTIGAYSADPFDRMVDRIAHQDGCSLLYDEGKTRGGRLIDLVKKTGAAGVIFCQMKFCDPEEFDFPIVKKELAAAGVPLLYVELEQQMRSMEQLRTQVETFAELLL